MLSEGRKRHQAKGTECGRTSRPDVFREHSIAQRPLESLEKHLRSLTLLPKLQQLSFTGKTHSLLILHLLLAFGFSFPILSLESLSSLAHTFSVYSSFLLHCSHLINPLNWLTPTFKELL